MKHLSWTLLLIAATLAACSSDDDTEPQNPATTPAVAQPELRPMYVDVTENALTDEAEARQETTTRAAITTTSTLSAFNMDCRYGEEYYAYIFQKDPDWNAPDWPGGVGNSEPIDFYAYTCDTKYFNYNNGNPYLSFTSEEFANEQHDLLVATHKNISYNDANGHVSLHFQHVCAAVNFRIGQSSSLAGNHVTFTKIALDAVCNYGSYHYSTQAWQDVNGNATYTLESSTGIYIPVSTKETNEGARPLDCGYLFLIPQEKRVNIKVDYTLNEVSTTATIPVDVKWEAGKKYTVDIRLGTSILTQ